MRIWTLVGLSALGMISSSLAAAWLATPTAPASAATADRAKLDEPPGPASQAALPGAVELEARVGHPVLQAGDPRETYLFFRAHARAGAGRTTPLRVVLLLDRSGSMRGKRLANAIDAARSFVKELRDGDEISIFAYDTGVSSVLERTRLDAGSRDRVLAKLSLGSARGNTCISCALERAIDELDSSDGVVSHVLLLSDGEATAGEKSLAGFQRIAQRAREKGVGVSSVGVDVDYNEALLSTIARFSNGRHHFAQSRPDLERAFDTELTELTRPIATNAVLDVTLPDGVELVEAYDRQIERDGKRVRAQFGTMTSEDEKTLLLKVRIAPGGPRQAIAADFALSYAESGSNARTASSGALGINVSESESSPLDPLVAARIGRSRTGALLFEAGKLFKSGDPSDYKKLEDKVEKELGWSEGAKKSAGASTAAAQDFEEQQKVLLETRSRLRVSRGGACGCSPGDLQCAMRCSTTSTTKPKSSCAPGDPLCSDVGTNLSRDEKAAAKESVEKSEAWAK